MKPLLLTILIFLISIAPTCAENIKEEWGDIDEMWLMKPFETREPFVLYSEPSKSSALIGKVNKGTILYLLDRIGGGDWYLLRETSSPYRKGWVTGGSDEDDAVDYKVFPLCSTLIFSEEAYLFGNPHLFVRKDKMPFTTVVADTATRVGEVNDKILELCKLDYWSHDVYCLYPEDFIHLEGKEVYAICVGVYKDKATKIKVELEGKGYQPFLVEIKDE